MEPWSMLGMMGVRLLPLLASLLLPLLLCAPAQGTDPIGSVTVVTVASDTRDASALLASAPLAGIDIVVLGEGVAMPWPTGLRTKIILVQKFVETSQLADDDLIVFVDAWDTMVLADSAASLVENFRKAEEATGRPIIFAPEEFCWPQDEESKDTLCAYFDSVAPPQYKRRYLNSGLYAGRHKAFKELFAAPIPLELPLSDQPWFQQQFRATEVRAAAAGPLCRRCPARQNCFFATRCVQLGRACTDSGSSTVTCVMSPQLIGLDYTQLLFAAHPFSQMTWRVSAQTGRWGMQDMTTGSRPSVVHWNGTVVATGHPPRTRHCYSCAQPRQCSFSTARSAC
jgi:hypothetical protein